MYMIGASTHFNGQPTYTLDNTTNVSENVGEVFLSHPRPCILDVEY